MFHRIAVAPVLFAAAVALMACGDTGSQSTPTSTESPGTQAQPEAPPAVAAAPPEAAPAELAAPPPESAQCLDLVGKSMFEEAVPVCVRAADLDPENTDVEQALETARTKAATEALGNSSSAGTDAAAGAAGVELP